MNSGWKVKNKKAVFKTFHFGNQIKNVLDVRIQFSDVLKVRNSLRKWKNRSIIPQFVLHYHRIILCCEQLRRFFIERYHKKVAFFIQKTQRKTFCLWITFFLICFWTMNGMIFFVIDFMWLTIVSNVCAAHFDA